MVGLGLGRGEYRKKDVVRWGKRGGENYVYWECENDLGWEGGWGRCLRKEMGVGRTGLGGVGTLEGLLENWRERTEW